MAFGGAVSGRPLEDFCIISAIEPIDTKVEHHANVSLVAWQMELPPSGQKVELGYFADDFRQFFNVRRLDIQVTEFFPEDFLVTLANRDLRDVALDAGSFAINGHVYGLRPWDVKLHAEPSLFPYHAHLCLEGLPIHAWTKQAVAQAVVDVSAEDEASTFQAKMDAFLQEVPNALP
ncbi:hypothetical protein ABZP36_002728 [Zizania latifolia]